MTQNYRGNGHVSDGTFRLEFPAADHESWHGSRKRVDDRYENVAICVEWPRKTLKAEE